MLRRSPCQRLLSRAVDREVYEARGRFAQLAHHLLWARRAAAGGKSEAMEKSPWRRGALVAQATLIACMTGAKGLEEMWTAHRRARSIPAAQPPSQSGACASPPRAAACCAHQAQETSCCAGQWHVFCSNRGISRVTAQAARRSLSGERPVVETRGGAEEAQTTQARRVAEGEGQELFESSRGRGGRRGVTRR